MKAITSDRFQYRNNNEKLFTASKTAVIYEPITGNLLPQLNTKNHEEVFIA